MVDGIITLTPHNQEKLRELIKEVDSLIKEDTTVIQNYALEVALKALKASIETNILECDGYLESAIYTANKAIKTSDITWNDPWEVKKIDFAEMIKRQDEETSDKRFIDSFTRPSTNKYL